MCQIQISGKLISPIEVWRNFELTPETSGTLFTFQKWTRTPLQSIEAQEKHSDMDQNLTQKTVEAINQASELALENSHQQLTPVHLAIVLLEDGEGLAQQAVLKHGNEETLR